MTLEPYRITRSSRPTILLVDDHTDLRDALGVLLQSEGYQVADATDGIEALTYLRSGAPVNAMIVDLDMPVMNGWDFLATCRLDAVWSRIPSIVVTGVDVAGRRRHELGEVTIFTKPCHFDDLLVAVRRVMIRSVTGKA